MKAILLVFSLCAMAFADAPRVPKYGFEGPTTFLAGGSQFYYFPAYFSFAFTCVAATDVCTASGHTPVNGEIVTAGSTTTLPAGLNTVVQWRWPKYALCNSSGSTFQLKFTDCTGSVIDITDTGTGTHYLYLLTSTPVYLDNSAGSGFPSGTTIEWRIVGAGGACNTAASTVSGKYRKVSSPGYIDDGQFCARVTVLSGATPGAYTPSISLCEDAISTNCVTYTFNMTVVAPGTYTLTPGVPASYPAIASLATWEDFMTRATSGGGAVHCNKADTNPLTACGDLSDCPEASVAFYDGLNTYIEIANYTGDAAWMNAARAIYTYCSAYILASGGGIPVQRVYGKGITKMASLTSQGHWDGTARVTATFLDGTTNVLYGFDPTFGEDRPNALALLHCTLMSSSWQVTAGSYCQDLLEGVISQMLSYTEASNPAGYQTFVMGLMTKSLEEYYDKVSRDARIPYLIKRVNDHVWANYDSGTHRPLYNTGTNLSPYCLATSLDAPWHGDPGGNCNARATNGWRLNNFNSTSMIWYWKWSGDATYRTRGDDMFDNAHDNATAKEFAQIMQRAFDFVRMRQGH